MTTIESITPPTSCDGRAAGATATAWGFQSVPCHTGRGLTRYTDTGGVERAYCFHHRHYVLGRWPERYISEIADDPLGQEKARKEAAIERITGLVDIDEDDEPEFDREGMPEFSGQFR
jgi:hypothetical protein